MSRPLRILIVTLALAAAGALFGALASTVAAALWVSLSAGLRHVDSGLLAVAAVVGAGLGSVLGPAAAWLLLRRVPLGRAMLGTAAGAVVGAVATVLIHGVSPVVGAVAGFSAAALLLRARTGSPPPPPALGDGGANTRD